MKVNERKMNETKGRAVVAFLTAAALGLLAAGPAGADFYKFTFGGEVDWLDGSIPAPWEEVGVGSPFEVSYIFDSEAEDLDDNPYSGFYRFITAEILVDGVSQATSDGYIWVNLEEQSYQVLIQSLPIGGAGNIDLVALPGTLETDELPLTLDLGEWPHRLFRVGSGWDWEFSGPIDTFSSEIVPAPASLLILSVGLTACAKRRRREQTGIHNRERRFSMMT